jgi:hypothetical protein
MTLRTLMHTQPRLRQAAQPALLDASLAQPLQQILQDVLRMAYSLPVQKQMNRQHQRLQVTQGSQGLAHTGCSLPRLWNGG